MARTIRAVFDGEVLRPEQITDLRPQATCEIAIEWEIAPEGDAAREEYPLTRIAQLAADPRVYGHSTRHDRYAHGRIGSETEDA